MSATAPPRGPMVPKPVGFEKTTAWSRGPAKTQARLSVGPQAPRAGGKAHKLSKDCRRAWSLAPPPAQSGTARGGRGPDHVTRARPPSYSAVLVFRAQRLTGGVAFAFAASTVFARLLARCPVVLARRCPLSLSSPCLQTWLTSRTTPNILRFSVSWAPRPPWSSAVSIAAGGAGDAEAMRDSRPLLTGGWA